jgi:hypothetical protein
MSDAPKARFDPFKHKLVGPLLIVGLLAGWLFSVVAAFYYFSKR